MGSQQLGLQFLHPQYPNAGVNRVTAVLTMLFKLHIVKSGLIVQRHADICPILTNTLNSAVPQAVKLDLHHVALQTAVTSGLSFVTKW